MNAFCKFLFTVFVTESVALCHMGIYHRAYKSFMSMEIKSVLPVEVKDIPQEWVSRLAS